MSRRSPGRRVVKFQPRPRISLAKAVLGILVALVFLSLSMGSILGIFVHS
jgi:hypothetical protein